MSTVEARTGYGNYHHSACSWHNCGTERLVADLTSGLWADGDLEDLDSRAVAPAASAPRQTEPNWVTPEQRADAQNLMVLGAATEDKFASRDAR